MEYIMVIDDSPTIRASINCVIGDIGYPVEQAENGVDALSKISRICDDGDDVKLCLVDVNMPEMDGITFIREFRKSDRFTPIVVITTESGVEKIKEGKDAGASGWLVKPFKPDELQNTVNRLIR